METIGQKIKRIRLEKGLTQKDLAALLGTSQQNLAQYEKDKRRPKIETIRKISDALNVPFHEFIDDIYMDQNTYFVENLLNHPEKLSEEQLPDIIKNLHYVDNLRVASEAEQEKWAISEISKSLKMLRKSGMEEAVRRVEELTQLARYRKIILDSSSAYDLPATHKSESTDPDPEALQHESDE